MTQPRFTFPHAPIQSRDSEAREVIPEEVRQNIIASLRQTIDAGPLPPRWAKRFEKELQAFEAMRSSP